MAAAFGIPLSRISQIAQHVRPNLVIDKNVGATLAAMTSVVGSRIREGVQLKTLYKGRFVRDVNFYADLDDVRLMVLEASPGAKLKDIGVHCMVIGIICAIALRAKKGSNTLDAGEWERIRLRIEPDAELIKHLFEIAGEQVTEIEVMRRAMKALTTRDTSVTTRDSSSYLWPTRGHRS